MAAQRLGGANLVSLECVDDKDVATLVHRTKKDHNNNTTTQRTTVYYKSSYDA